MMTTKPQGYTSVWTSERNGVKSGPVNRYLSWTDSSSGAANPRFRQQIKAGGNASTDFSGSKGTVEIVVEPECSIYWNVNHDPKQPGYSVASGFTGNNTPSFDKSTYTFGASADNTAIGRFYKSARSCQTEMQGMTFLGELAETIHMIRSPAKGLRGLLPALLDDYANLAKRYAGRRLSKKYLHQALAGVYLEHVFGWLPFINDTKDAIKAYNSLISQTRHVRCRGFGEESKQVQNVMSSEVMGFGDTVTNYTIVGTAKRQVVYYGAVRGNAVGMTQRGLDLFGFRADEFLPTVWELTPFSFLVDYFTNVGDIVSAGAFVDANLAWVSKTVRLVNVTERTGVIDQSFPSFNKVDLPHGGGGYKWKTTWTSVQRFADGNIGVPSLQFHLPGSDARWCNIAALGLQSNSLSRLFAKLLAK